MKHALLAVLPLIAGCPAAMKVEPQPIPLTQEFYDWTCRDYEDYTEITITTQTCDEEVRYIVAELHLTTDDVWKTNLKQSFDGDCHWEEQFLLTEEYCIQVEGVALTAWVD